MSHKTKRFIDRICAEAFDSAAVNHPYLRAISIGDLPNLGLALQDFALQYGLYSTHFTQYVSAVAANLSSPDHKRVMFGNLAEEQGNADGVDLPPDVLASIVGRPHASLYRRFQQALGVDEQGVSGPMASAAGVQWSQHFLTLCQSNQCVGVGAIGIGTELIVSRIYSQILVGLETHSNLTPIERVFFDLHSQCDEAHAVQMMSIASDLAQDTVTCGQIEYGARMAIDLRVAFWDSMLERAQNFPAKRAAFLAN